MDNHCGERNTLCVYFTIITQNACNKNVLQQAIAIHIQGQNLSFLS